MNINFQKELDKIIEGIKLECREGYKQKPKLLLHACCAPCSSYCIEYLEPFFDITLFFYNPNMSCLEEYDKRASELKRLVKEMGFEERVKIYIDDFQSEVFDKVVKGLETEPERGARCTRCFDMRLIEAAKYASMNGFDYYATTLTISPHKNANLINELGMTIAERYDIMWLYSDFKKKNGYKRSIELSGEYGLYRQDFCGCIYSQKQREIDKFNS